RPAASWQELGSALGGGRSRGAAGLPLGRLGDVGVAGRYIAGHPGGDTLWLVGCAADRLLLAWPLWRPGRRRYDAEQWLCCRRGPAPDGAQPRLQQWIAALGVGNALAWLARRCRNPGGIQRTPGAAGALACIGPGVEYSHSA